MAVDPNYNELNRASTERIRTLAGRLTDAQLQTRVGQHWTVAIALAHLAWWDRRVMYVLDMTEKNGTLFVPEIDIFVNDLSLPLWAAIPPRKAAEIAIETSETLDKRLETFSPALLEEIYEYNKRWVVRALHRGEHLGEVDAALETAGLGTIERKNKRSRMAKKESTKQQSVWPQGLSNPAKSALAVAGITRLTQLTKYTEKDLLKLHGMGPKGTRILAAALKEKGLAFKSEK
jgi:hypothetical protein